MWYILSFAFQLSGGLILLLWAFRKPQEQIVYSYYPIEAVAEPNYANICTLKKERVQAIATNIYRNRFAFGDLCAGYLIAVIAETTFKDCENLIFVLIITGIITGIEYYFAEKLSKKNFPEDMKIHSSELEKLGVCMYATDRESGEVFGEIFDDEKNV